jgi:hypothetical protein
MHICEYKSFCRLEIFKFVDLSHLSQIFLPKNPTASCSEAKSKSPHSQLIWSVPADWRLVAAAVLAPPLAAATPPCSTNAPNCRTDGGRSIVGVVPAANDWSAHGATVAGAAVVAGAVAVDCRRANPNRLVCYSDYCC